MMQARLLLGDCRERLRELRDGSVDMVLTDPPYGITRNEWDKAFDMGEIWPELRRVSKENAAILISSRQPWAADVVNSNRREFRYEWIYEKSNATGFLNAHKMPLAAHENILTFYRRLPGFFPQMSEGEPCRKAARNHQCLNYGRMQGVKQKSYGGERFPRSVIKASNADRSADKGLHPTQKPVALLEYLIRSYTREGELVLDCFMGSGSTGAACISTGRRFVGIEMDKGFFEIAETRLRQAGEQQRAREDQVSIFGSEERSGAG